MFAATESDLIRWILAGVLLAGTGMRPSVALDSGPQPSVLPKKAVASPAPTGGRPAPALPEGQVWQCVVGAQRIFSDAPCGANASIRQLNPINRMASTQIPPSAYDPTMHPVTRFDAGPQDFSGASDEGYEADLVYVHGVAHRTARRPAHRPPKRGHAASR